MLRSVALIGAAAATAAATKCYTTVTGTTDAIAVNGRHGDEHTKCQCNLAKQNNENCAICVGSDLTKANEKGKCRKCNDGYQLIASVGDIGSCVKKPTGNNVCSKGEEFAAKGADCKCDDSCASCLNAAKDMAKRCYTCPSGDTFTKESGASYGTCTKTTTKKSSAAAHVAIAGAVATVLAWTM